jgi:hypothetical protein
MDDIFRQFNMQAKKGKQIYREDTITCYWSVRGKLQNIEHVILVLEKTSPNLM